MKLFQKELLEPKLVRELSTTASGRLYTTPVGTLPSVTTVLGSLEDPEGLVNWRKRVGAAEADRITQQAAVRGTILHHAIESYLDGKEPVHGNAFHEILYVQIKKYLENYLETIYGIELPVYSAMLKGAGKLDLGGRYRGIPSIIDFKTSKERKREEWIRSYFLQTTAYAMMIYELYGIKIPQIVILMATEDNNPIEYVKKTAEFVPEVISIFRNYHKGN